jgi:ParB/RepB/Spo0J family partition protein
MATKATVQLVSPDEIERNPENPRLVFKKKEMETLLESVSERGVIVPLIVYPDESKLRLLDGERRLRIVRRLNLKEVPVNIIAKPTPVQNILQMFHIHNVRQSWELIETAKKLKVLLEDPAFKEKDVNEISRLVGLSPTTINRCKELLSLDPSYQQMILDTYQKRERGEELDDETKLTEDFFIESRRAINSIKRFQKSLGEEIDDKQVLAKFVEKRKKGTFSNVVEMGRTIPKIIAAGRKGGSQQKIATTIKRLIEDPDFTVKQAYESAAEPILKSLNIEKGCTALIDELTELHHFRKRELEGRREDLLKVLTELGQLIKKTIAELG